MCLLEGAQFSKHVYRKIKIFYHSLPKRVHQSPVHLCWQVFSHILFAKYICKKKNCQVGCKAFFKYEHVILTCSSGFPNWHSWLFLFSVHRYSKLLLMGADVWAHSQARLCAPKYTHSLAQPRCSLRTGFD